MGFSSRRAAASASDFAWAEALASSLFLAGAASCACAVTAQQIMNPRTAIVQNDADLSMAGLLEFLISGFFTFRSYRDSVRLNPGTDRRMARSSSLRADRAAVRMSAPAPAKLHARGTVRCNGPEFSPARSAAGATETGRAWEEPP